MHLGSKFGGDIFRTIQVIDRMSSDMVAILFLLWRPCFFSKFAKIQYQPSFGLFAPPLKIWWRYLQTIQVIDLMSSDMAAILFLLWRPCFFSEFAQMQYQPTLGLYAPPQNIWWRYLETFLSYWSDVDWLDPTWWPFCFCSSSHVFSWNVLKSNTNLP